MERWLVQETIRIRDTQGKPILGVLRRVGRAVERFIVALANASATIAAVTVLAMCLLITGAVFMRYVFGIPVVWAPEIVGYLLVGLIFLALGEAMLAGGHIKIDLFVSRVPRRFRDMLELFTLTLSTGVAGFFAWHGVRTALRSYEYGRKDAFGALNTPLYIPQSALPIGLSILTLVLVLLVCRKLYAVINYAEQADGDRDSYPFVRSMEAESGVDSADDDGSSVSRGE
jgi:TRAP-type C4-dicarboxylate transport system permease small subunit